MVKTGLTVSLLACLALPAVVANELQPDVTPKPSPVPVSQFLQRAAKSPLGPGEVGLLRAVADLIEKEQVAGSHRAATAHPESVITPNPAAVAVHPASTEQRERLVIRLSHSPVIDVAKALEEFLDSEHKACGANGSVPNPNRAVFVPEPVSNSLLLSARPEFVQSLTELITALDAKPDTVMVNVCIAELLLPSNDAETEHRSSSDQAPEKEPSLEKDGAAWLAWAEKHGRLDVFSRPQIMTLDSQPAFIEIKSAVPTGKPNPGKDGPAQRNRTEQREVGLSVGLTPRITPEGLVLMELDVERATVLKPDGAGGPIIGKTAVQTTVSAKDGQTVVLGGLIHRVEDDRRSLIFAVTPRVNPKR